MSNPENVLTAQETAMQRALQEQAVANQRKSSIFRTIKTVMWSFVGLRSSGGYERDVAHLNPVHIIIAGFVGVFVFVGSLILLVTWVVGK